MQPKEPSAEDQQNVVRLVPAPRHDPDVDVINQVLDLCEKVERGEISSLGMVWIEKSSGAIGTSCFGPESTKLLGATVLLQQFIMDSSLVHDEDIDYDESS